MQQVGHRRRRRWLNDKSLRDMAGHVTAGDMEAQFKPIPFGEEPPASVFTQAMSGSHAATWEGFRNIDMDKEARVLQVCPAVSSGHRWLSRQHAGWSAGASACAHVGCSGRSSSSSSSMWAAMRLAHAATPSGWRCALAPVNRLPWHGGSARDSLPATARQRCTSAVAVTGCAWLEAPARGTSRHAGPPPAWVADATLACATAIALGGAHRRAAGGRAAPAPSARGGASSSSRRGLVRRGQTRTRRAEEGERALRPGAGDAGAGPAGAGAAGPAPPPRHPAASGTTGQLTALACGWQP